MKFKPLNATQKSTILAVLAGVGVGLTGFVSAKCSQKAEKKETRKEKAIAYIPAIGVGAATIGCIGMSTKISHDEIAALTVACAAITQKFVNYKKAVEEVATEEQKAQINEIFYLNEIDRLEQELAEREYPREDDDLCTFVDSYCGYTFKAPLEQVEYGLTQALELYKEQGFLPWCDIFILANDGDIAPYGSYLGADYGYDRDYYGIGWSKAMFEEMFEDTDYTFDICLTEVKDKPNAYIINYSIVPEPFYMEY